ncbi:ankyrin repeat domain-containing protein [Luteimonas pelagia]
MPESRPGRPIAAAFALAVAGGVLLGAGGVAAALGGLLAQPAHALAVAWWRAPSMRVRAWRRDALALLAMWTAGGLLAAALVAWPLLALRQGGSLGAAVGLSLGAGLALVGLWRTWPLWHAVERHGGPLRRHWQALPGQDATAWRGLAAAALVAVPIGCILLAAWPGLLPAAARWALAAAMAPLGLACHALLQRLEPAGALALPVYEVDAGDDDDAADAGPVDGPAEADLDGALFAAARGGRVERALELLEGGADAHARPPADARDQRGLAVLAAVLPDLRLLRALIGRGVGVNEPHGGLTPLLAATRDSWHGRPEAVMTLLANGADPRAVDAEGNTPLHHAARSSDPGVAALLRDAGAELDVPNAEGVTPLGMACGVGNWRLARFLLERGARPEVPGGTPALLAAAGTEEDDPAGVQLLLKHKAKLDARDATGRSALHEAAAAGHAEIISVLLAAGADVHAADANDRTPWLEAARSARPEALDRLLQARPVLDLADTDGRDALALAVVADAPSPVLVQRLVELGLDPHRAGGDGRTAVDLAAERGRWTLVALLDPGYPLPSAIAEGRQDAGASTADHAPVHLLLDGLREGRLGELDALVRLLAPGELDALLHAPEVLSDPSRLAWLLSQGADPERPGPGGEVLLPSLLDRGAAALGAIQPLLRRAASPAGGGGLARFLGACAAGDQGARGLEAIAIDLLDRGADPFGASPTGDPPLALAVRLGWPRLQARLVAHGADLDASDARGMTPLHLAAALGRAGALRELIAAGADPAVRAPDGQTPLGVALSAGRRDLADWLDWRGWTLPHRALQPEDLPAAAIVGDADAVRRLLELGLPVDAVDGQGCTALLRAAGGGHRAVVDLLLDRGADPQRPANTGATPLSAAVSMRQVDIVDRLLLAGADLEQRLPGEVTVLMLAAALGLPDLVSRLLAANADLHARDAQDLTALHCATLFGFTARDRPRVVALLDALLLAGADHDPVATGGATPLLMLLGARAEPGTACDEDVVLAALERLLDEEVALDARDARGFGPLHLAALHGLLRVVQRLLRAGADPELRDGLNRTPREIAVMRGFVDVAAEFGPTGREAPPSMARFLRNRD